MKRVTDENGGLTKFTRTPRQGARRGRSPGFWRQACPTAAVWHAPAGPGAHLRPLASCWRRHKTAASPFRRPSTLKAQSQKLTFSNVPKSGLCHVSILMKKSSFIYSFCGKHNSKMTVTFRRFSGLCLQERSTGTSVRALTLQEDWPSGDRQSLAADCYRLVRPSQHAFK